MSFYSRIERRVFGLNTGDWALLVGGFILAGLMTLFA
jgi:hypothetical protein